jgi:hypothetical protein
MSTSEDAMLRAIGALVLLGIGAVGTPLDNQDVGNWSCMPGLGALFVETSLLAFSGYALGKRGGYREALLR